MAGEGLLRAQWNKVLLEDVVVPAYLRLLELASGHLSPAHQMQLWPVKSSGGPWDWILSGVYTRLSRERLFWSEGSHRWVDAESSILLGESCQPRPLLERIYISGGQHVVNFQIWRPSENPFAGAVAQGVQSCPVQREFQHNDI
jgi:hypothetical protein